MAVGKKVWLHEDMSRGWEVGGGTDWLLDWEGLHTDRLKCGRWRVRMEGVGKSGMEREDELKR